MVAVKKLEHLDSPPLCRVRLKSEVLGTVAAGRGAFLPEVRSDGRTLLHEKIPPATEGVAESWSAMLAV